MSNVNHTRLYGELCRPLHHLFRYLYLNRLELIMEILRFATLCIFLIIGIAIAKCGGATLNGNNNAAFNSKNIVWFPNPLGEGVIPAKLTPTPRSKVGDVSDIHYLLFTKANQQEPIEIWLDNMENIDNFITGAPLKLMVHGFGGGIRGTFPWGLKDEYLNEFDEEYNIILMDWTILSAQPDYFIAYENAQIVAEHTAKLFKFLVENGKAEWSKIHLLGHSLGGQVVGQIGNRAQLIGGMINHITSLDPAMPIFDLASHENRTSPEDATFVEVVHTACNGIVGYFDPCGHVDWYPNGGRYQPGCGVDIVGGCAHERANLYYIETLTSNIGFYGRKCETYEEFENGDCNANEEQLMGHPASHSARGTYFSNTNRQAPFAAGQGNF